ncbi:MAG TPA: hypothetical protein VHN99_04710 [Deinococcales bacterium]|nr:hypothetical protein [Deinococcales bacterium]
MTITILTQESCAFCGQAQALLERLKDTFEFEVQTLEFNSPEGERLAMAGGLMFPPGILIDGRPFSYGRLSEGRLRRELAARAVQTQPATRRIA